MPSALAFCLCLIGALFFGALVGFSYAQLKLPKPEDDGYFQLQNDLAEQMGMGEWARLQRSKPVRWASFVMSLALFLLCVLGIAWFAALTFLPAH